MLSNDELSAIKALDLAPEVEEALISLKEKHRELLFTRDRKASHAEGPARASPAKGEDQSEADIKTISGSRRSLINRAAPIPWDVQFSD